MASYAVLFRTTQWDPGTADLALRATKCCRSGNFVIAPDEVHGQFDAAPYSRLFRDDTICGPGLPEMSQDESIWWNVDFVLYTARKRLPSADFYVLIGPDVYLQCDMDELVRRCDVEHIDLISHDLKPLSETDWRRSSLRAIPARPWRLDIAIVVISGRAVDTLARARQAMARSMQMGSVAPWPYCEAFIPTVLLQDAEMRVAMLADFVDTALLRQRPVLSIRDPQLQRNGIVAHPVMSGARFIAATLAEEPTAERSWVQLHLAESGSSQSDYDEAFVNVVFANQTPAEAVHPDRLLHFSLDSTHDGHRGNDSLALVLREQASKDRFVRGVKAAVHEEIFGMKIRGYNIDTIAGLSAAIDASQYAATHMRNARRFQNGNALRDFAVTLASAPGLVLEFGVFSGYTINRFAQQMPERTIFGFDSFEGLPEAWVGPWEKGSLKPAKIPLVLDNVELLVGWFDQTLPQFLDRHPNIPISLLHIDCDLYSSTRTVFSLLHSRIVPGTVIVFDEYISFAGWRLHEYKAFQEFVTARHISYEYSGVVPDSAQVLITITESAEVVCQ